MSKIHFTVVIPTCNRAHMLLKTLDSLGEQSQQEFEVIVVCDGDDPQVRSLSKTYCAKYSLVWIFMQENKGPSCARNAGASSGKGDLIVFLDDDMIAPPDWLSQHSKHYVEEASNRSIAICGKVVDTYLCSPNSPAEEWLRQERVEMLRKIEAGISAVSPENYALRYFGANCSVDRASFLAVGGFDPVLRIGEDMEIGNRLFDHGFRFVFEPQAVVHHHETKEQETYLVQCWKDSARVDVYRAQIKGQRNPQTRALTLVRSQHLLRKLRARLSFGSPRSVRAAAQVVRHVADLTGSRLCFRIWAGLKSSAEYWDEVSSQLTQPSLFRLVGWPFGVMRFRAIEPFIDSSENNYHLSDARFFRFLQWFKALGGEFLSPEVALVGSSKGHGLILSFDGGHERFCHHLLPQLVELNIRPLIFLVPEYVGKTSVWDERYGHRPRPLLSISQIREIQDRVQFGSLGLSHIELSCLSDKDLHWQVEGSKSRLEDILGSEVDYFAYPWGTVDARVRAAVAKAGYRVAFSERAGLDHWDDRLFLKSVTLRERDSLTGLLFRLMTDQWPPEDSAA